MKTHNTEQMNGQLKQPNPFIVQTAKDYDMTYSEVKSIHDSCGKSLVGFYEKLEDFIKERAKSIS
jgi:hypothetical protein